MQSAQQNATGGERTQTIIAEYQSEAKANGREAYRATFSGSSVEPRVMKRAANQAERWGIPYSTLEVIEVTDPDGPDECHDSRGNLDECLALVELYMAHRIEDGMGFRRGSIRPLSAERRTS